MNVLATIGSILGIFGVIGSIVGVTAMIKFNKMSMDFNKSTQAYSPINLHTRLQKVEDCVEDHTNQLCDLKQNLRDDIKGVYDAVGGVKQTISDLTIALLGKIK
jgi:hypothetical protein